jgi:protocatechuate 3,4-dioxygenase alpha subunit
MTERPRKLAPTLSQTVGPFFHLGLSWLLGDQATAMDTPGRHITVRGRVLDGDGIPVPDALLEAWQADANGDYTRARSAGGALPRRAIQGFLRMPTDDSGAFQLKTIKPGPVPLQSLALQAPHIAVHVFMNGLLRPLVTRIYFGDEVGNESDFVLGCVPLSRQRTLIAEPVHGESDVFAWNVILQGAHETVFFDG